MATYRHGGKSGDLIYALPSIKQLGGGILCMDVRPTHQNQGWPNYDALIPLLEVQHYIDDVIIEHDSKLSVDYDFKGWNERSDVWSQHLSETQAKHVGLGRQHLILPWLTAPQKKIAPIVISRSLRTHGASLDTWQRFLEGRKREDCVFLGFPEEQDAFIEYTGFKVVRYPTEDFLQVAGIIAGSELFLGNQSAALAIAEGLGKERKVEVGILGHYFDSPWGNYAIEVKGSGPLNVQSTPRYRKTMG